MANVMTQKGVKNNVHRSGFDLSKRVLFTSKTGEILPIGVFETIPGDKFTFNLSEYMKTVPFVTANFGRLKHYVDAYFVPIRLLWDKFPDWIVQTDNQHYARSIVSGADNFTSQPYITLRDMANTIDMLKDNSLEAEYRIDDGGIDRHYTSVKLMQSLGYGFKNMTPNGIITTAKQAAPAYEYFNPAVNIFPLLAYQKIYQDYFRFDQWEKAAPWTYNLDYVLDNNQLHVDFPSNYWTESTMFDMRYCNYDKDMFNGLLPSAQFGEEAVASPILGSLHGTLEVDIPHSSSLNGSGEPLEYGEDKKTKLGRISAYYDNVQVEKRIAHNSATLRLNQQDSNSVGGVSILGIRFAEALQKWKEITLSGSPEYKDQLEKHWNVHISDYASDRCKYLGGMSQMIDVSEVVNQNLTGNNMADLGAKGSLGQNAHFEFSTDEYGIIMIVSHVKPVIEWASTNVLHPFMFRHLATDYAQPEFDNLGQQAVMSYMLDAFYRDTSSSVIANEQIVPLGYAPRYFDYKTNVDTVTGGFLDMPQWTLTHRLPEFIFQGDKSIPKLSASFFRVTPTITDNLFAFDSDESTPASDPYYHSVYMDVKVVRNLSYDGLPY